MGYPTATASNATIYTTYTFFLCFGLYVGWRFSRTKADFLSALRTQSGSLALFFLQEYPSINVNAALPLALNFSASGESCARNGGPSLRQRTVRGMF
jgi:hypothetical protein